MTSERRTEYPRLRLLVTLSSWALSMFEEKRGSGRRLSMTRCAVAAFTVAYVYRLLFIRTALGWPDAWLAFAVLFAVPIAKALDRAPAADVVGAVTGMFGKGADAARSAWASTTSAWTGSVPTAGEVLTGADLVPPVSHGRADE